MRDWVGVASATFGALAVWGLREDWPSFSCAMLTWFGIAMAFIQAKIRWKD